jgi:alpha-D-ribose 1-methylphosphonate 5-triphosphate diphosphatase
MSLMDHTPGQRQFRDVEKLLVWYRGKGQSDDALKTLMAAKVRRREAIGDQHREALVGLARRHRVPLASHDDSTVAEVEGSVAEGAAIAEFPVTVEAAEASRARGMKVLMGAPNLVRGGSHSGNVAAEALARLGHLDILSSDYVPGSLIQAAFELPRLVPSIDLSAAVAMVTSTPAEATGLNDRGRIEAGLRADLVRVRLVGGQPVVRSVWSAGERVA